MRRLTQKDFKNMPWKNGGGTTTELLRIGAGDAFDFRLSIARVNQSGPFSEFPGVDRTLLLLSGNGIYLNGRNLTHSLVTPLSPFSFRGEEPITGELLNGEIFDFNVMVRRDWGRATTRVETLTQLRAEQLTYLYLLSEQALLELNPGEGFQFPKATPLIRITLERLR